MAPPAISQICTSLLPLTQTMSEVLSPLKLPTPATRHSGPILPTSPLKPVRSDPLRVQIDTWPEFDTQSASDLPSPVKSPTASARHSAPIWPFGMPKPPSAVPLIDHTARLPRLLCQRISVLPSALKSPAPATCHSAPMPPAGVATPRSWLPFICQIVTCPEPLAHNMSLSPSWLKSPVPTGAHSAPIWAFETERAENPASPASATAALPPLTDRSPACPLFAKSPVPMNCPEPVATTGLAGLTTSVPNAGSTGSGGSPKTSCTPLMVTNPSSELRPPPPPLFVGSGA